MKLSFVNALVFCGCFTSVMSSDVCLTKTEYDFYMLRNLLKDVEKRVQCLKENVKGLIDH
jgi:hypothetical protein